MTVSNDRILRTGVLVFVFVLAGLAAAGTEWLRARQAARWSAAAELSFPEEWVNIVRGESIASPPLDPHVVVDEAIAALEPNRRSRSLDFEERRASAGGSGLMSDRDAQSLRQSLRATVDRSRGEAVRIGFHFSASSADRAVRELNGIVRAYGVRIRMALAREVLRRAAAFQTADERVDRELGTLGPELDKLVDRAVRLAAYRSVSGSTAEDTDTSPPSPFKDEPTHPVPDSAGHRPDTEVLTKLEELRQRRAQLLLDRTPAHPDVRHVEALIAEAEKQLEKVPPPQPQTVEETPPAPPRRVVAAAVPGVESPSAPASSSPNSAQWTELFRSIQALQVRIEGVYRALERTRGQKFPGGESLLRGEDLAIRWAERAEMTAAFVDSRALVLVAFAAGLVATAGIAMVWAGVRIDPPIIAARDVEHGLSLPVIGTITADQVPSQPASSRLARARWKWPCIVGGLAVVAAYFIFLLQPFFS